MVHMKDWEVEGGAKKKKGRGENGKKNLSEEQRCREKRKERGERNGSVNPRKYIALAKSCK